MDTDTVDDRRWAMMGDTGRYVGWQQAIGFCHEDLLYLVWSYPFLRA
jgi:hypothetical protein